MKVLQKAIAKSSIQIMKETSRQIQINKKQYNFNGTNIQEKQHCNYEDNFHPAYATGIRNSNNDSMQFRGFKRD